jgi:lipopolysaccharide/colanic/teichoic acid biosynthesis glycosyltransferase
MLVLSPVAIVIAATIVVLSRRGPLVRHTRVGWRGVELPMLKFRTMWDDGEAPGHLFAIEDVSGTVPVTKTAGDSRVHSRFAAFCRRYSLDELPQLYHVARGEMSLVGPRPITLRELEEFYGSAANEVLSVRPGLTGLWQVLGRNRLNYERRKRLDLWFVRRASAGLYLQILRRSVACVFSGRGAY